MFAAYQDQSSLHLLQPLPGALVQLTDCSVLAGYGFYEPYWLLMIAQLAVVIHLIGGYQVWTQPFLMACEAKLESTFPESKFLKAGFNMPAGRNKVWRIKYYILVWRSIYVVFTTIVAILAPFFNDIVGEPKVMPGLLISCGWHVVAVCHQQVTRLCIVMHQSRQGLIVLRIHGRHV